MSNQIGTYETKCRRCGKVHFWTMDKMEGCGDDMRSHLQKLFGITSDIQIPLQHECDKCEINTIHDLVSYSE